MTSADDRREIDWDSVAPYYDAYVTAGFDIPFFLAWARRTGGPVLELMCGTGRVTLPLIEAGLDVTGIDRAAALNAHLRRKLAARGLTAAIHDMDVRGFDLGRRFGLVFIAFHAFAEILGEAERRFVWDAIRAHLRPDGRFILTLHNPAVRSAAGDKLAALHQPRERLEDHFRRIIAEAEGGRD